MTRRRIAPAPARIAMLPPAERVAWTAYIARSAAQYASDTAAMSRELRALHRARMARAPYTHEFSVKPEMTPGWFASEAGRRMAEVILSFQATATLPRATPAKARLAVTRCAAAAVALAPSGCIIRRSP